MKQIYKAPFIVVFFPKDARDFSAHVVFHKCIGTLHKG